MVGQGIQTVGIVPGAAGKSLQHHLAVCIQHIAYAAVGAARSGAAAVEHGSAVGVGGQVVDVTVLALQGGQVADKPLRAVQPGGGGLVAVVILQFQPDVAGAAVAHPYSLLVLHRFYGGVGQQLAVVLTVHPQTAVQRVDGYGVVGGVHIVQRGLCACLQIIEFVAMALAAVPCYHIAREILAGLLVKGGDQSAVLCGHVPQFVPAVTGGKAGKTTRIDLQKARVLLAGLGVVQDLVGGFLSGGNVQLHPVAQGVAVVEKAVCRGGLGAVDGGAVLLLHHHPAVLLVVGIPVVIVQSLRAGVAAEHQLIAA